MTVLVRAQQLFDEGRQADAIALVEHAAAAGDSEALFALANWRMFALYGERDLPAAHAALARAAGSGHVDSIRVRAFLIANGTGCARDPDLALSLLAGIASSDSHAALQVQFLPQMMAPDLVRAAPRERLSEDPFVELVRGLLTPEERSYVRTIIAPNLRPSWVINPATGERIPHPVRTSWGTSFGPTQEDLVIHALNCRIADATGTAVEMGEPLHILRYQPGQEYRPHIDALPGVDNQRIRTALVYLNDDYRGGETTFPELGLTVRGQAGDALIFHNVTWDGRPDPRTLHAGLPVAEGEKWLATRWIRQAPYHPWAV
ncbi:2OG-Fe(II) oxygenase [Sphingosinicella sp. LHD-64]|uniref:2OG-Fe(II) oxygenase n=1 Tax=Sphingosinicella sp. LHD-64 TaxID=3072139 RepID=UPI0028105809|nr:2OG-Fe(II) oxygenase [Sphingosinicella sp. LHD-64]MDQ8756191.1 2OG-Fe(II) oxygenase [Sphingosinicella sp. LHD-64]